MLNSSKVGSELQNPIYRKYCKLCFFVGICCVDIFLLVFNIPMIQ